MCILWLQIDFCLPAHSTLDEAKCFVRLSEALLLFNLTAEQKNYSPFRRVLLFAFFVLLRLCCVEPSHRQMQLSFRRHTSGSEHKNLSRPFVCEANRKKRGSCITCVLLQLNLLCNVLIAICVCVWVPSVLQPQSNIPDAHQSISDQHVQSSSPDYNSQCCSAFSESLKVIIKVITAFLGNLV